MERYCKSSIELNQAIHVDNWFSSFYVMGMNFWLKEVADLNVLNKEHIINMNC